MTTTLDVLSAYDERVIGTVDLLDWSEIEPKLNAALAAFADRDGWPTAHARIDKLHRLAELVEAEAEDFAMLIAKEGGKPLTDARVEVARAINGIKNAAEEIANLKGIEIPMGLTPAAEGRKAFTSKEPRGVVVAVSAFNHPLNLIVHQVVPALATGCPVLVKPAGTTPLNCLRFVELAHKAGFGEAWVQAVPCGNAAAEKLVTHPKIAFFSFIGSARVGWMLRSKLAPGTRCALEHGGVAPAIVDKSANLEAAIPALVKGGYYHAGQVCVSVQRIYVHDAIFDDFVARYTGAVAGVKVGDPTLAETEAGPLISPAEVDRVAEWVTEATDAGATCTTGGEKLSNTVYKPTVLVNPPADVRVSNAEVFGPVTCLYRYSDIDDALAAANGLDVAFQAAIFTEDLSVAMYAGQRFDATAVMVNDHTAFRVDWMPFAGRRSSGYGTGGISYTMEDMVQDKMIVLRHD